MKKEKQKPIWNIKWLKKPYRNVRMAIYSDIGYFWNNRMFDEVLGTGYCDGILLHIKKHIYFEYDCNRNF